ncbi:tRNA-specific adenosine deaminase 2 [Sphaceloma murrayae]|uniref:tRNA-specific adenosine deaminase 2 n=1 Tax=Sphaceloma murrayae TaxID=2082308 RepID=A0A2K1QHP3_9PEZI|nr:tRNA-specific adenosine deaminase 2 [Sphaceloma murrayae]
MSVEDAGYQVAFAEMKASLDEGGMPIGSSIVNAEGKVIGRGRNMRVQNGSPILHAETAAFDSVRYQSSSLFKGATLYTTLSPCPMCAGSIIWFGIKKLVIGENRHMSGREEFLRQHGVEVVILDDTPTVELLAKYIEANPDKW